jgi:hypothetical protein
MRLSLEDIFLSLTTDETETPGAAGDAPPAEPSAGDTAHA